MDTHRSAADRASVTAALVATAWLLAVLLVDLFLSPTIIPDFLFAIAPLIACSVLPARTTARFCAAAVLLTIWSGWRNDTWITAQEWVRFLDVLLVSGAAMVIAVVRVRREQKLTRVTAIAETAQRAILPKLPARTHRLRTAARYLSAATDAVVGGDLYDCSLTEGYTRFIVGDVRGKGLGAVEQAARVIRAFRQAAAVKGTLGEAASDMHSYLTPFFDDEEFATALLVDLTEPDVITLTSCGHPAAILIRAGGEASFLEPPAGLPLGVGTTTEEGRFSWGPGDRLLLYTDGLSEARDEHGEFLPLLRLAPLLADGDIEEALDQLLDRARAHVPRGALADDLAVLVLEHTLVPQAIRAAS